MADEAVWVPQAPARSQSRHHSRSSSIGWKSNFPFIRKRAGSATEPSAQSPGDKNEEMAFPLGQGLRKKGARAFKRSSTTNDIPAAAPSKQEPKRSRTESPVSLNSARGDKLAIPEGLSRELHRLGVQQQQQHSQHSESTRAANVRRSRSFDDLKQETAAALQAASKANWEDRRQASGKTPVLGRRSPGISPSPDSRRPSRAASSSPRPVPSGNAWRQEAKGCPKADNKTETSSLSIITEAKLPTPPQSPGPSPLQSSPARSTPREHRVDGVDFEMLIPPTPMSTSESAESSEDSFDSIDESCVDDLATFLDDFPTPGAPEQGEQRRRADEEEEEEDEEEGEGDEALSASPTEILSPFFSKMIAFPAPPPIPQTPPEVRKARWTMMSSSRASSIFLPDSFEQPEPSRRHKRASSENDTKELERKASVASVQSRPPAPPPKDDEFLKLPTPSVAKYRTVKPVAPLSQTPSRMSVVPPLCPRGTLPTPRSKFNPHPTTSAKTPATVPSPPTHTSAGARIAAAAAKESASAVPSRRVSLKQKPPARSTPSMPMPLPVTAPASKSNSPTSHSPQSAVLKRRSSDLGERRPIDGAKATVHSALDRSKSQVRREMVKKMALDNIGAVKAGRPSRSSSRVNPRDPKQHQTTLRPEPALGISLERKPSRREIASSRSGKTSPEPVQESTENLFQIQASKQRIGSLEAELKRLEEQCAQAKKNQQALNEQRQRLQDAPTSPSSSEVSETSSDESVAAAEAKSENAVNETLGSKIESWQREVQQAEQKRDRIRKKLAWHNADRLKLAPRLPKSIIVAPVTAPLRGMGMGISIKLLEDEEDSTDCPTARLAPTAATERPATAGDELSMTDGASVDENAEIPPTPEEYSPPMTAANNPWLGLDNPFLASAAQRRPSIIVESIKSPATVTSPRSDRQTIQLFAGEDIMADIALSAAAITARNIPNSPMPRQNKSVSIQVFADNGLAVGNSVGDLVSALQQEIDDIGRDFVWNWERP